MQTYLLLIGLMLLGELKAQPVIVPDQGLATLVLFRDQGTDRLDFTGRAVVPIWLNGTKLCPIGTRRYAVYRIHPQRIELAAGRRGLFISPIKQVRIEAEAGAVYYVGGSAHESPERINLLLYHLPETVARRRLTNMQPTTCLTDLSTKLVKR